MLRSGSKLKLGDLLVAAGEITKGQLDEALAEQKDSGKKLGRILVAKGFVQEDRLLSFLADQLGVPFVDLKDFRIDEKLVALLPETHARRYRAIVLAEDGDSIQVGMADPIDIFAYDEIARQLNKSMSVAVVRESDLMIVLDSAYRRTEEIVGFASELEDELSIDEFKLEAYQNDDEDTPVAKLLQSILEDAAQIRASDVHVEPGEDVLRLRMRVDGVLQEQTLSEVRIAPALVSRLKLMAGLDISEKRLPQDGKFEYKLKNTVLDIRLSTLPTTHGESLVMRLVDHANAVVNLDGIGMNDELLERFRAAIRRPNGLVLVTGPTGSGKTTTLYGALQELNSLQKKIVTVEDPVEINLDRAIQVQVNSRIGLDFARVLRTTLRQDPDIILVGEIRDSETAEIALRAAMTGHVVLSTLHTNDAIASVTRLMDIGVPGYMVAASVRVILAQRLIRRLCEQCKVEELPDGQDLEWLKNVWPDMAAKPMYRAAGCNHCAHTGYMGRMAVAELLQMKSDLADALRRGDTEDFAQRAAAQEGYVPLVNKALEAAAEGITSIQEVMNLAGHEEEIVVREEPLVEVLRSADQAKPELDMRH